MNPVLEYQHVSKQLNSFAIQDVSFSIERGYIMGLGRWSLLAIALQAITIIYHAYKVFKKA